MTSASAATRVSPVRRVPEAVTVDGITWTVHSRNERSATVNGRHLFACRCRPSQAWAILEMDRPADHLGGRREIARHGYSATHELSRRAMAIPQRNHFSVYRSPNTFSGRNTITVMSPGGLVEAVFYGDQHRERAENLAAELNVLKEIQA